ncbi:hypothetical protein PG994_009625 [Apiospora phragmitis]|uniref:Uncharacterized protein n=1 Tax=Apiospora phragmitis TaxID=2905665 RepID=A0ABR1U9C6_9PEZI
MHFSQSLVQLLIGAATVVSAIPQPSEHNLRSEAGDIIQKRADFDPVKACKTFRPAQGELMVLSEIGHNVVFDPKKKNFDTKQGGRVGFLLDAGCALVSNTYYEARGSGNGWEAHFKSGKGKDVRARIGWYGSDRIDSAKIQYDGKDVKATCTGQKHKFEGLDVDHYKTCNFKY